MKSQQSEEKGKWGFFDITDIKELSEPPSQIFQSGFCQRAWLKNRGKQQYISFSDKALKQLRKYFDSLDADGSGAIGVDELEDPFIAFGLSETREEVEELVKSVDLDGSGQIEFNEFLAIMNKIKRGKSESNSAMFDFFQRMSTGQLGGDDFDDNLSFKMNVSQFRRKKLLDCMMADSREKREKGSKILQNFRKQIITHPKTKEFLDQSKKSNIYMYGFETNQKAKK